MGSSSPVAILLDENQTIKLYTISLSDVKHKECEYNGSIVDIPIASRSDSERHILFGEFRVNKPIEDVLMFLLDSATAFRRYGIQLGIKAIKNKYSVDKPRERTYFQTGEWHYFIESKSSSVVSRDGFANTKISCTTKL